MKSVTFFFATLGLIVAIHAHPGRTDSKGGHYNRSTGEYHYHNSGSSSNSSGSSNSGSSGSNSYTPNYQYNSQTYNPPSTTTPPKPQPKPEPAVVKNEAYYRDLIAKQLGGEVEVRMEDGTYCDILTSDLAIEVDWAHKWGEAIGQSLNYGYQSNKTPAIYLILTDERDLRYYLRVNSIIHEYNLPIKLFSYKDF